MTCCLVWCSRHHHRVRYEHVIIITNIIIITTTIVHIQEAHSYPLQPYVDIIVIVLLMIVTLYRPNIEREYDDNYGYGDRAGYNPHVSKKWRDVLPRLALTCPRHRLLHRHLLSLSVA